MKDFFAGKMMGDGAAVEPTDPVVKAPADGEMSFIFPTHHAIGFVTADGMEMLLHIGIDTVKLNGEGFEILVEERREGEKGRCAHEDRSGLCEIACAITGFSDPLHRFKGK